MSAGCWVILYEDGDLKGKTLKVDGPVQFNNLKNLPNSDQDWGDKIGSVETGPHARLTVYDDEDFSGDHIDHFGPGTRTTVSGSLDDNIDSIIIEEV